MTESPQHHHGVFAPSKCLNTIFFFGFKVTDSWIILQWSLVESGRVWENDLFKSCNSLGSMQTYCINYRVYWCIVDQIISTGKITNTRENVNCDRRVVVLTNINDTKNVILVHINILIQLLKLITSAKSIRSCLYTKEEKYPGMKCVKRIYHLINILMYRILILWLQKALRPIDGLKIFCCSTM